MNKLIIYILFFSVQHIVAQIENSKTVLANNKVKSSFEKHCFTGSSGGCSSFFSKYDRRGNVTEWNFGRIGTIYRSAYDKNDNKILYQWIDKSDTTDITNFNSTYDKFGHLTSDNDKVYTNEYDSNHNLIQIMSESLNDENETVRTTVHQVWSNFKALLSKRTMVELVNKHKDQKLLHIFIETFDYDIHENLIKEQHFNDYELTNTITYKYDTNNREIERVRINPSHLKSINSLNFNDREDLTQLTTKRSYNSNGTIKETYTYFSDPCMSLDNHFLYKHMYLDNGLLQLADVYEDGELIFTISYEYEFYNK